MGIPETLKSFMENNNLKSRETPLSKEDAKVALFQAPYPKGCILEVRLNSLLKDIVVVDISNSSPMYSLMNPDRHGVDLSSDSAIKLGLHLIELGESLKKENDETL